MPSFLITMKGEFVNSTNIENSREIVYQKPFIEMLVIGHQFSNANLSLKKLHKNLTWDCNERKQKNNEG